MDDIDTPSDSFPQFKDLDDVLKCGICYETLTTPVLTSCFHTFCSVCIRRWLTAKQVCPSCSEEIYESSLRRNTIVVNILDAVQRVKKKIFGKNVKPSSTSGCHGKTFSSPKNEVEDSNNIKPKTLVKKAHKNEDNEDEDSNEFRPKTFSRKTPPAFHSESPPPKTPIPPKPLQTSPSVQSTPAAKTVQRSPSVQSTPAAKTVQRSPSVQSTPVPKTVQRSPSVQSTPAAVRPPQPVEDYRSPGIKVPCPSCNVMMAQGLVFDHLDYCKPDSKTRSSAGITSPPPGQIRNNMSKSSSTAESSNPPLQPIKKMVIHLLKDKQLKTEMKKYGLSIQGDRRALQARFQRFVILYNAECDSDNPRTLPEIIQAVEREEKAVSTSATFSQMFKKTNNPEEIATAHKDYLKQNKSSYDKLIEDLRKRSKNKPSKKEECVTLSDSEDDPAPLRILEPAALPLPGSSHATNSGKWSSDSDSDVAPVNSLKTPNNRKNASKNMKRKCIESESEEEDDEDIGPKKQKRQQEKRVQVPTSPVLSRKTPVRQLRSRTVQNGAAKNNQTATAESGAKNSKRGKPLPKPIVKRKKEISSSESSDEDSSVQNGIPKKEMEERKQSLTPDLFESLPSPSSSGTIPCGQRTRDEESGSENDALNTLVEMMDNDTGSTTDFED